MLTELPPGLLDGLPQEDQQAINEVVGRPLLLNEFSDDETAEFQFTDSAGDIHFYLCEPGLCTADLNGGCYRSAQCGVRSRTRTRWTLWPRYFASLTTL
jgi:hypothetical protein